MGTRWRAGAVMIMALPFAVVAGCGDAPTGNVSGAISYKKTPLTMGTIMFMNDKGKTAQAQIKDGKYTIVKAPVGEVLISVQVPELKGRAAEFASKYPKDFQGSAFKQAEAVPIPAHYADVKKSNLRYAVKAGEQTHDIDLP